MQSYATIIGVIELRLQKQSYDIVQKSFGIGFSTVTLIMKRFKEMGLSIDNLKQMEPRKLETAFYPSENRRDTSILLPDYDAVYPQMVSMGRKADLAYIWLDCKACILTAISSSGSTSCPGITSRRTMAWTRLRCPSSESPEKKCTPTGLGISPTYCRILLRERS